MNEATKHFKRIQAVFDEVITLQDDRRELRLAELCQADAILRSDVDSLLSALQEEFDTSGSLRDSSLAETALSSHSRIGAYQIESLLGRGGMGAVYLAHRADGEYTKKVAIKLIDLPLATNLFRERFRNERQILAGLDHPSIARMLDGGVSNEGDPYLVMEYVKGDPLNTFCTKRNLPLRERLKLFQGVCEAVQFAHQNLVVHRDLKPDNILVDDLGRPHLLDFGTAKILSAPDANEKSAFTREGFLSFTPQYASPEQVLGKSITTASDTYSLGVLLYLLLSNSFPYELNEFSTGELVRVICNQPPRRVTSAPEFGSELGTDLEAIVNKALRKEPERRYGTAQQIILDIQAYLDDQPVSARQGTLRYKTAKLIRRNRLSFAITALLTASFAAGSGVIFWQARIANQQRQIAEARSQDLRELSNSLLSELDEAIKQIPGSVSAQQLLVSRVLEHVDGVAQDAHGDKLAELDLASAYTQLGKLQGDGYEQNLGDKPGALKSLSKAVTIAESLAMVYPRDPGVLTALARAQDARGETLSLADDNQGASESLQASIRTYKQLLDLPGVTPQLLFEAADVYDIYGDLLGQDTGFGDAPGALQNYFKAIEMDKRALAIDSGFMRVRRGLVTMQMKLGNVEMETDPAAALREFEAALEANAALPAAERERLNMQRLHALLLRKEAMTLSDLQRFGEADPIFRLSFDIYKSLSASDPKDIRALEDVKRELENEAQSYYDAGDPVLVDSPTPRRENLRSSEQLYVQEESVLKQLIQAVPKDTGYRTTLNFVHVRLGSLRQRLNEEPSVDQTRSAMNELKVDASHDNASPLTLALAATAFLEVEPEDLREPLYALEAAKRGDDMTHHKSATWLFLLAKAYHANGRALDARLAAEKGISLLASPDGDNSSSKVRKLLENELPDHRAAMAGR